KEFLKRVPPSQLRDGDVWLLNLPEVGGNHLPDVKAIRPIFTKGRLLAFAINLAHCADIGGAVPGSYVPYATEAHQEGVRISPLRLFAFEGVDREKVDFLLAPVSRPEGRALRRVLRDEGAGGARRPAQRRLLPAAARARAAGLDAAPGSGPTRRRRQSRDVAAGRRRDRQSAGGGDSRPRVGRRADDVRRHD